MVKHIVLWTLQSSSYANVVLHSYACAELHLRCMQLVRSCNSVVWRVVLESVYQFVGSVKIIVSGMEMCVSPHGSAGEIKSCIVGRE